MGLLAKIFFFKSFKWRIYGATLGSMLALSIFFIYTDYHDTIRYKKMDAFDRLESIARSIAITADGDEIFELFSKYPLQGSIKTNNQDPIYYKYHLLLKKMYEVHELKTPLYMMRYESDQKIFTYTITSSPQPSYLAPDKDLPKRFFNEYVNGGVIGPYEDGHGTWFSAMQPIKNAKGQTVCIIKVDNKLEHFESEAMAGVYRNTAISIAVSALVGYIMFLLVSKSLADDKKQKKIIENNNLEIQKKNKKITDSILYAKRIQKALMPTPTEFKKHFDGYFQFFLPKDIVSGDFIWNHIGQQGGKTKLFIAAVDCTGHGVPGALMSMLGISSLSEIITVNPEFTAGEILHSLDQQVIRLLHQNEEGSQNANDGMDMSLCIICPETQTIDFAGAHNPIALIDGSGELHLHKASKFGIGGLSRKKEKVFESQMIKYDKGDKLYLYTDGYVDQFGGNETPKTKFKSRQFKNLLKSLHFISFDKHEEVIKDAHIQWRNGEKQLDDITVIGIQL